MLVDTKLPGFGRAILDKVRSVTNKPVTTVINTHTHSDHTGGNPEFPRAVEFVAHEQTKANMERMDAFKGENAAFRPRTTFKDRRSLLEGLDRIDLYYFGAGSYERRHDPCVRRVQSGGHGRPVCAKGGAVDRREQWR